MAFVNLRSRKTFQTSEMIDKRSKTRTARWIFTFPESKKVIKLTAKVYPTVHVHKARHILVKDLGYQISPFVSEESPIDQPYWTEDELNSLRCHSFKSQLISSTLIGSLELEPYH